MKSLIGKYLTAALLILAIGTGGHAQQVWPGDVNNNGIVNEVDLLYWGLAFGSTGPARAQTGTDWQAYDLPASWAQSFPGGLNYAYADCDGNGMVDEDDYDDAIEDNFGLQHAPPTPDGYSNAAGGNAPRVRLQPSVAAVEEGAMLDIALSIDDAPMPIDSFYGLALTFSYTTGLLEGDDGPDFELEDNNWIEADGSLVQEVYDETGPLGTAALAVTRTNQLSVPVQEGEIGRFYIVIEDIIVGLEIDTFIIRVDSIKLITSQLNTIAVVPDTAQVIVAKDLELLTNTSSVEPKASALRVFPNPARERVFVQSDFPLEDALLIDPLGRSVPVAWQAAGARTWQFPCSHLPPGLYWLRVQSPQGIITKAVTISL